MQAKVTRDDLQAAFDRHRVRYGMAKAQDVLATACGVRAVADVVDDKMTAGFDALQIKTAVLRALGVAPLVPSKLPPPFKGQKVEARLGEMAKAIYPSGEQL